jgi:hypothetical protein
MTQSTPSKKIPSEKKRELINELECLVQEYEEVDLGGKKEVKLDDKKVVFEKPEIRYENPVYILKPAAKEQKVDLSSMGLSEHARVLWEHLENSDLFENGDIEKRKLADCERELKELRDEDGMRPGEEHTIEFENGKAVFVCLEDPLYMVETLTWRGRIEIDKGGVKPIANAIRAMLYDSRNLSGDITEKREEDLAECEKKLRELRDKESDMIEGEKETVEFENGKVRFIRTTQTSLRGFESVESDKEKYPNFLAKMPGCPQGIYMNLRLDNIRNHANVIRYILTENKNLELEENALTKY